MDALLPELIHLFTRLFTDLHGFLSELIAEYDVWTYGILFLIIFCETGLVVTPFLPGDSLLFAAGTFTVMTAEGAPAALSLTMLILLLGLAAFLGDTVNYHAGKYIGPKVFTRENVRFLNRKHLDRAHEFYEKYGGKTIIIARFIPIVRTFAPFVAGIGKMSYFRFISYNVIGGMAWVIICTVSGHYFANVEFVKKHFEMVVIMIVLISILPAVIEVIRAKRSKSAP